MDADTVKYIGWLVATLVGAVAWVYGESNKRDRDVAKRDNQLAAQAHATAEAELKAKLAAAEQRHAVEFAKLEARALDSDSRFALIERRVGDDKPVIDVTKLTVSPRQLLTLDPQFQAFDDGLFYLDTPSGSGWEHAVVSEAELMADAVSYPEELAFLFRLPPSEAPVHVWRSPDQFITHSSDQLPGPPKTVEWRFHPQVILQWVTNEQIATLLKAGMTPPSGGAAPVGAVAASPGGDHAPVGADAPDAADAPNGSDAPDMDVAGEQLRERLQALFRGKFSMLFLTQQLRGTFGLQAAFAGVDVTFDTIQQAGNVLYVASELRFTGAPEDRLTVIQEWFLITIPAGAYFVKLQIPTRDRRNLPARAWTNDWLAGLRLPAG